MAKPTGACCNLDCARCLLLERERLYPGSTFRMSDEVLEPSSEGSPALRVSDGAATSSDVGEGRIRDLSQVMSQKVFRPRASPTATPPANQRKDGHPGVHARCPPCNERRRTSSRERCRGSLRWQGAAPRSLWEGAGTLPNNRKSRPHRQAGRVQSRVLGGLGTASAR